MRTRIFTVLTFATLLGAAGTAYVMGLDESFLDAASTLEMRHATAASESMVWFAWWIATSLLLAAAPVWCVWMTCDGAARRSWTLVCGTVITVALGGLYRLGARDGDAAWRAYAVEVYPAGYAGPVDFLFPDVQPHLAVSWFAIGLTTAALSGFVWWVLRRLAH